VEDVIAAIATPPGQGAIAVIRMTGSGVADVVGGVFKGSVSFEKMQPRKVFLGEIQDSDGGRIDEVLVCRFAGPASYTGEDLIEISCHGGVLVTGEVYRRLLDAGARAADPGEFTRRAFTNGKMELTQAEAVMDLISAQTALALRSANEQLAGGLGGELERVREDVLSALAHIEAYIDFPDEDISPDTGAELTVRLGGCADRIVALLDTADHGRMLREGVRTVICGTPNVGKSSLLNRLLGFDRAIVSDVAGTTRDTIEEVINLRGFPLRLVDTAGVRESEDAIEREGIERAERQLESADLIVEVIDASRPASQPRWAGKPPEGTIRMLVMNKCDLGCHTDWKEGDGVLFSCADGTGEKELEEAVFEALSEQAGGWSGGMSAIRGCSWLHGMPLVQGFPLWEEGSLPNSLLSKSGQLSMP